MAAKNLRQSEFRLGKIGLVLLVVGLSILVFTGFLLGVQVGRNIDTYPDMIARGIPSRMLSMVGLSSPVLKPEMTSGIRTGEPADPSSGEDKTDKAGEGANAAAVTMTPPTSQNNAGEQKGVATPSAERKPSDTASSVPGVPSSALPPQKPSGAATAPVVHPAPAQNESKPEQAASEAKVEAIPKEKKGKFIVQVVSFREKEKADGLGLKIVKLGYKPHVSLVEVTGKGSWYRVTVNSFTTKQAAEKAANDLAQKIKGVSCVVKSN